MNVIMAAPEAFPYAKTGGLADMAGTLAKELSRLKIKVLLIMPFYRAVKERVKNPENLGKSFIVEIGGERIAGHLYRDGNTVFIGCDRFYDRPELYGTPSGDYPDNPHRFIFFARAVFEAARLLDFKPDVIHCHDWQTGLVPLFLKAFYSRNGSFPFFAKTKSVLTIHNMGYQGIFSRDVLALTGLPADMFTPEGIEFYGKVNFLKAGIIGADMITTVSPTYAGQIQEEEYGFGLEGVLRKKGGALRGILNGIDYSVWDPGRDGHIPETFNRKSFVEGKAACKKELASECGFKDHDAPLVSFVGRLSYQKGVDLISAAAGDIVSEGVNLLFLGKGDSLYQEELKELAGRHVGRVYARIGYEEDFAHLVYAGSDIFLMPSRYEPCGLGQMIALRYGTPPVAADTGGITDTVRNYLPLSGKGTGFLYTGDDPRSFRQALWYALCAYKRADCWKGLVKRAMAEDFSWKKSASLYKDLYDGIAGL